MMTRFEVVGCLQTHLSGWEVSRWQRGQRAVGWRKGGDLSPLGDKKDEKGYSSGRKDDDAD